jgi:hypothetical protein
MEYWKKNTEDRRQKSVGKPKMKNPEVRGCLFCHLPSVLLGPPEHAGAKAAGLRSSHYSIIPLFQYSSFSHALYIVLPTPFKSWTAFLTRSAMEASAKPRYSRGS